MTTSEKVAYLKGLIEGAAEEDDRDPKEEKIVSTFLDILEDLALEVQDLSADIDELDEGLDAVSDDLADVEEILFGDEYEDEEDLDDEDCDCEDCEEPVFYEAECPACGEVVTFDEGVLAQGAIECPACGENLEFELDAPEDEEE
jgi:hypothetical protein